MLRITIAGQNIVEQEDYSLRAEKTTDDEIGYLVKALNTMLDTVEQRNAQLEESNQRFGYR
ncbi:MAG: hypothetical protein P8Y42_14250 [Exilibacterium sp.]